MPATIRSLDSYKLEPNFSLGLGIYKPLSDKWGLTTGLHLENKGMNIDATVKNYHMAIVREDRGSRASLPATTLPRWRCGCSHFRCRQPTPLTATCT